MRTATLPLIVVILALSGCGGQTSTEQQVEAQQQAGNKIIDAAVGILPSKPTEMNVLDCAKTPKGAAENTEETGFKFFSDLPLVGNLFNANIGVKRIRKIDCNDYSGKPSGNTSVLSEVPDYDENMSNEELKQIVERVYHQCLAKRAICKAKQNGSSWNCGPICIR